MQLLTIVAILFVVLGVLFALQNNVPVVVSFLIWNFEGSLALVLLIALALGGMIVALVSTPGTLRRQMAVSRLQKRVADLEKKNRQREEAAKHLASSAALPERNTQREEEDAPYVGMRETDVGKS